MAGREGDGGFSPDGTKLLTLGPDGLGKVWDATSGRLLFTMGSKDAPLGTVDFTPDGKRIFSTSIQTELRIWDASTGKQLDTWPLRSQFPQNVHFSPESTRLIVSISDDNAYGLDVPKAQVWDVTHGREVLNLRGHTGPFWKMYFLPGGRRILSSSADTTTRQWETFPWHENEYLGSPDQPLRERVAAYAQTYWRERLRAEMRAARKPAPPLVQPYLHWDRARWPKRYERAGPNQIDLLDYYTTPLDAGIHPHFGDNDNNLREISAGTVTLSNVVFDVRGVIGLRRLESGSAAFRLGWEKVPVRVDGIKIGKPFRRLHVLHAVGATRWDTPSLREVTEVGSYVLRYSDGTQHELPIQYGRHLREWWALAAEPIKATQPLENGIVAWTGSNPAAKEQGNMLRLYLTTYANPRPDLEVKSIDYVSALTDAAPFLVALTIEP